MTAPVIVGVRMTMDQAKIFFNPQPAIKRTERIERRFLSRYGAFVRNDSRKSIRKRKKPSQPGMPPSSHKGYLKNNIVYVVDSGNVWIFPTVFKRSKDVPGTLEKGGHIRVARPLVRFVKGSVGRDQRGKFTKAGMKRVVTQPGNYPVRERPYMEPAKDRTNRQLSSIWAHARNIK